MNDYDEVVHSLRQIISGTRYVNFRQATTGKLNADGSLNPNATDGLPDGYIWLRFGEDRSAAVVKNMTMRNVAGVHVEVVYDLYHQEDQVWEVDRVRALEAMGAAAAAAMNVPEQGAGISTPVSARDVVPGGVFVDEAGGLNVRIAPTVTPFGGWWDGTTLIALTPTATANSKSLIMVGIQADGTSVTQSAPDRALAKQLVSNGSKTIDGVLDSLSVRAAYPKIWWVGAVELTHGAASIDENKIADERFWALPSMVGADVSSAGYSGLVPKPAAGDSAKFLRGDGTWVSLSLAQTGMGDYIAIQDQKTSGTGGGTFTSGAWQKRDLNTEVTDTGGHASIASSQITLAAGTYRVSIIAPGYRVGRHQARLYDVTNSAVLLLGTDSYSNNAGDYALTNSIIYGRITLTGTTVLEVQHRCQTTHATNGFGLAAGMTTEIYTVVELLREADSAALFYQTVEDNEVAMTQRAMLDFADNAAGGVKLAVTDDAANDRTIVQAALDFAGITEDSGYTAADDFIPYQKTGSGVRLIKPSVLFGAPPALGGSTPNTGAFTTLDTSGNAVFGAAGANSARLNVNAAASGKGVIVRANATTPGNALEIQNSAGTVQSSLDATGKLTMEGAGTRILVRDLADAAATIIRTERGSGGSLGYIELVGNTTPSVVLNAAGGFNAVLEFKTAGTTNMSFGRDGTNRFFVKNSVGTANFTVHLTEAAIGVGINAEPEQAAILAKVPASAGGRRAIDLLSINSHTGPYLTAKTPSSKIVAAIENDGAWHSYPYTNLTNTIQRALVLGHNTNGSPDAGYGVSIVAQLENPSSEDVEAGRDVWLWNTATHASRKPDRVFYLTDAGGEREIMRMRANGSAGAVGFFGATPVAQQTGGAATAGATYGATEQTMLQAVYDALRAFGLIS